MRSPSLLASTVFLVCRAFAADTAAPPLPLIRTFPSAGAVNVCPDAPLRLHFKTPPTLGTSGKIRIHDAASHAVVETFDVASPTATRTIGGENYTYYPVFVEGTEVTVVPRTTLAYGKSYYVTVDAGAFRAADAPSAALEQPTAWIFSTKPAPPAPGADRLIVAADGSGDFCTVQGAIDFVPPDNARPVVLELRRGVYREMVNLPRGKDHVTLRGESRKQSIITYANNARFNPRVRSVVDVYANDFTLEQLTIRNPTPRGGSQAETLRVRADRTRIAHCDFSSLQDTLQLTGRVYVDDCYVEGDVDFVWGSGTVYFHRCEFKALNPGYLVQSRNGADRLGYIFADCRLTAAPEVMRYILARIEPSRFPHSHVAFLDCALGPHISAVAWQFDRVPNATEIGPVDQIRFQEYRSTDLAGQPLDVAGRHPVSRQLTPDEAAKLRDLRNVFGDWHPLP